MEDIIDKAANDYAETITKLSDDEPYLREAALKIAVREIVWALYHNMEDQNHLLEEMLQTMAEAVNEEKIKDFKAKA